jgi:transposase
MYVGIDVSKNTLDVALIRDAQVQPQSKLAKPSLSKSSHLSKPRHKVFANTPAGHEELLIWLGEQKAGTLHICLEATGTYAEGVALALHEGGHTVSLVNPALIRAFGQSRLSRTKTDKADAQLIAAFCQMHQPPAWSPPTPELRELQALVRRLEALAEMRHIEENRLQSGVSCAVVRASLEEHILYLEAQIEKTRRQIKEHVDQHPTLQEQRDLLVTIPGIAHTTAVVLLAELGNIQQFACARQVAAFAGLVPRLRQSGTSVRGRSRLSKAGSPRLRKALYFPALVALRFNPLISALGERLRQRSKSKMLIVGAAMRKLLHLAYGVLKSGQPFSPDFEKLTVPAA